MEIIDLILNEQEKLGYDFNLIFISKSGENLDTLENIKLPESLIVFYCSANNLTSLIKLSKSFNALGNFAICYCGVQFVRSGGVMWTP